MKLISIKLKNIGLYKNQTIYFSSNNDSSSTIIWGNNGAGKTTLLNSIKIGLLGEKAYKGDYEEYITFIKSDLISSRCDITKNVAEIVICIELKENNKTQRYTLTRSWSYKNESLSESLDISLNGESLNFYKRDKISTKIFNILPPTLLDIVIFNGEEVIDIIQKGKMNTLIKSIISAAFGMDVYANLIKDLTTYQKSITLNGENDAESILLLNLENEYKKELNNYNGLVNQNVKLQEALKSQYTSLNQALKRFSDRTGVDYSELQSFKNELSKIESSKKQIDEVLKIITEDIIPLRMLLANIIEINCRITNEKAAQAYRGLLSLQEYFKSNKDISKQLCDIASILGDVDLSNCYKISDNDKEKLLQTEKDLSKYSKDMLLSYFNNRSNAFDNLKEKLEISGKLSSNESNEQLNQIEDMYNKIIELNGMINEVNTKIEDANLSLSIAKNNYEELKKELLQKRKESNAYLNVISYKDAFEDFYKENIKNICSQLDKGLLEELWRIRFRNNSIYKTSISPKTFELSLYEKNGKPISSTKFSAGEKQLLLGLILKKAMELAKIDSFFLFDTPVGRLDVTNRNIFTNEVILKVSDQVMIFATDSDYSETNYMDIKSKITNEMKLSRDTKDKIVIKEGGIY